MTARPVPYGTADALARVVYLRGLSDALRDVAHELDPVIRHILGPVGDPAVVLEQLGYELNQLWSLITDDWCDLDLDELTDADWQRHSFATRQQEEDHRHAATVTRLVGDIEGHIALARLVHAERQRRAVA